LPLKKKIVAIGDIASMVTREMDVIDEGASGWNIPGSLKDGKRVRKI